MTLEFGGQHHLNPKRFSLSYSLQIREWDLDNYGTLSQLFGSSEEDWTGYTAMVGFEFGITEKLSLRGGVQLAQDEIAENGIRYDDIAALSFGATIRFTPTMSLDAGIRHTAAEDSDVSYYGDYLGIYGGAQFNIAFQ